MLNISFFIAAFTSISWLIFSLRYIQFPSLTNGNIENLYYAVMITALPVMFIWMIFFIIKNFYATQNSNFHLYNTLEQIKRSNDAVTALGHALQNTEIELKSSFALREFDTLVTDTNEVLSDIIKRSNSISSTQMEHLWARTSGGERWIIAKTFIETYNFQQDFTNHLLQKAQRDCLLKGSILEFHARYRNLQYLLETFDKQKIFYNMIEYGALGKVFRIITPIAEKLTTTNNPTHEKTETQTSPSAYMHTMTEEPLTFPSFFKEDTKHSHLKTPEKEQRHTLDTTHPSHLAAPTINSFDNTQTALHNFKASSNQTPASRGNVQNKRNSISLDELEKEINASPENNYDEYAYPFGNWSDDKK